MKNIFLNSDFNYKQLKIGAHDLPVRESMVGIVLYYVYLKKDIQKIDIIAGVRQMLKIPDNIADQEYDSSQGGNILRTRIAFTISDLKNSGFIECYRRGFYKITDQGEKAWSKYGSDFSQKNILESPEYIQHQKEVEKGRQQKQSDNVNLAEDDNINSYDLLDNIDVKVHDSHENTKLELKNRILEADPWFFEKIVVQLLAKMGYKGEHGRAYVTQKSNDGGIDGIINLDPLGTQTIYIQAKRYTNNVGRPEIESFYGALSRIHATRGVFVTTAGFSQQAIEAAKGFSITLIDGEQLMNLLIDYKVGVQIDKTFTLYKIDEDLFLDE